MIKEKTAMNNKGREKTNFGHLRQKPENNRTIHGRGQALTRCRKLAVGDGDGLPNRSGLPSAASYLAAAGLLAAASFSPSVTALK
jgi:hypothetical protein